MSLCVLYTHYGQQSDALLPYGCGKMILRDLANIAPLASGIACRHLFPRTL